MQETPIAVIGMACILPGARNLREFWDNVVNKVDSITDVPADRWDINDYYDPRLKLGPICQVARIILRYGSLTQTPIASCTVTLKSEYEYL